MAEQEEQRPAGPAETPPAASPPAASPGPASPPAPFPVDVRSYIERRSISPTAFAGLSLVAFFVLYGIVGSLVSLLLFGMNPDLTEPGGIRAYTALSQVFFLLVPAVLLARLASRDPLDYLRARSAPRWRAVAASIVGIASLQMVLQVYLEAQKLIPLPPELERAISAMKDSVEALLLALLRADSFPEFLAVTLVIAVLPAITEEVLFRGLIQRSFERGMGPVRAFVVTGIIFGAFHLNPFTLVPLMALGVYLGFVAWRADSIWVSAAAHFFNNLMPVAAGYFGVGGEAAAKGDLGSLSMLQLFTLFWFSGVIFLLSMYYFLRVTAVRDTPAGDAGGANRS